MGETTTKAPDAEGEELEITELVEFDPTRLDGVKSGANGFPFLIMKSVAGAAPAADGEPPAEKTAADHAAAAVTKAVVDGQVDQGPDVTLGQQILHLLGQAMINEAQEVSAGAYGEVNDVSLLGDAARLIRCWLRGEQSGSSGSMDAVVMDSAWAYDGDDVAKESREFSAAERKKHAAAGHALPDGSYPIPDKDALRRAAILARSKHGNWQAAEKLIARRARELGVPNPLTDNDDDGKSSKSATLAEGETTVQTDAQVDDGQIAKAVEDAVTKAIGPLQERIQSLDAELAKVKATPVPGGLVLSANARPSGAASGGEDWAAKAAYYEQMAATVAAPSDADNYRQLAAQARAKATAPA